MGADAIIIKDVDSEDGFAVLVTLDVSLYSILLGSFVYDFEINVEYSQLLDLKVLCWLIFIQI